MEETVSSMMTNEAITPYTRSCKNIKSQCILTLTFYILTGSCIWCNSFIRHHTANSVLHDININVLYSIQDLVRI
jgi:hypothetical protein